MSQMKGPAIFLAQFTGSQPPFDNLANITRWAGALGYKGVQIPTWEAGLIDLAQAAQSRDYCDQLKGVCAQNGVEISELSTHLQGQLVAVHPAYDEQFDAFAPAAVRGNPGARQDWAVQQLQLAARASRNLGLDAHATFSGALLWHTFYPWPQRPPGLVETGFAELANRWRPILDAFDEAGVDLCYEIHPGEDLHDRRMKNAIGRQQLVQAGAIPRFHDLVPLLQGFYRFHFGLALRITMPPGSDRSPPGQRVR